MHKEDLTLAFTFVAAPAAVAAAIAYNTMPQIQGAGSLLLASGYVAAGTGVAAVLGGVLTFYAGKYCIDKANDKYKEEKAAGKWRGGGAAAAGVAALAWMSFIGAGSVAGSVGGFFATKHIVENQMETVVQTCSQDAVFKIDDRDYCRNLATKIVTPIELVQLCPQGDIVENKGQNYCYESGVNVTILIDPAEVCPQAAAVEISKINDRDYCINPETNQIAPIAL